MSFSVGPYHRFPSQCFVIDSAGPFQGQGIVCNFSPAGCRLSVDLACSLSIPQCGCFRLGRYNETL